MGNTEGRGEKDGWRGEGGDDKTRKRRVEEVGDNDVKEAGGGGACSRR